MKLYSARLSLFARKVEIVLGEKGLAFERVMVPFTQERGYGPRDPDVLRINPKRQVPVLIDGDLELYDSTVILEYLEDAYPVPTLLPREPAARARCRLLELYADEVMMAALRPLLYRTGPRDTDADRQTRVDAEARTAEAAMSNCLDGLDRQLGLDDYLLGAFSIADVATFMMVLYSRRLGGPVPADGTALADWYSRVARRPAVASVVAEIGQADRELSYPIDGSPRRPEVGA